MLSGLDLNDDLALAAEEVTSSAQICNGTNAPTTPWTQISLLNPCGDAPGIYDEVLVRAQDGTIVASFSDNANGKNTRFSVLTAGTYQTTDGDNCVFSINSLGNITYESHNY
jgi:hypothetical protein